MIYSQLSSRRTPLGLALSFRFREMSILQTVKQDGHLELLPAFQYSQISLRQTPLGAALSVRLREMSVVQRLKQDGHLELPSASHYGQISLRQTPLGAALSVRLEKCPSYRELNKGSKERRVSRKRSPRKHRPQTSKLRVTVTPTYQIKTV